MSAMSSLLLVCLVAVAVDVAAAGSSSEYAAGREGNQLPRRWRFSWFFCLSQACFMPEYPTLLTFMARRVEVGLPSSGGTLFHTATEMCSVTLPLPVSLSFQNQLLKVMNSVTIAGEITFLRAGATFCSVHLGNCDAHVLWGYCSERKVFCIRRYFRRQPDFRSVFSRWH